MTTSRLLRPSTALLLVGLCLALIACGSSESAPTTEAAPATTGELSVANVWSRLPAPGQTTAAVYAEITNGTDAMRQIIAVTSTATDTAELHETVIDANGVARMQARNDGFTVDSGQTMLFEPGGAHVMLRDIDPAELGESIDLVFEFDDGESLAVTAEVRDGAPTPAEDHSDHSDHDMDTMDDGGANSDDAHEHDAHDHGDDHEPLPIDVAALHQVDDELMAGTLDAASQRAVVADYIAEIEALQLAADNPATELLDLLRDLDAALADGDITAASALATESHDLAHDLAPHD